MTPTSVHITIQSAMALLLPFVSLPLLQGNIIPCGDNQVEVCIPSHNARPADNYSFSCCNQNPSGCIWAREGNLTGGYIQEITLTGKKLTLQPVRNMYGQYNCLQTADGGIVKQILFIPRSGKFHVLQYMGCTTLPHDLV